MQGKKNNSEEDFLKELRSFVGVDGEPQPANDPVNPTMIRHWCDAMEDFNPNYFDIEAAKKGPHKNLTAPPAMLNAWTMSGLHRKSSGGDPQMSVNSLLDSNGFVGVVATNSEHAYNRYLQPGDHISAIQKLIEVSPEKQTALGIGHFITTETEYRDQSGECVGSMLFRILKFIPGTGKKPQAEGGAEGRAESKAESSAQGEAKYEDKAKSEAKQEAAEKDGLAEIKASRPPPSMNADTSPFWESAKKQDLSFQYCEDCQSFQHPPAARCIKCKSKNIIWKKSSGRGTLYSHCRVHYPKIPAFAEPPIVGLIELEEGVRFISNITDCPLEKIHIGMDLQAWFHKEPDGTYLPLFRPVRPPRNESGLKLDQLAKGQELPICPIPITTTQIVAGAIASRDYQDVHHDPELAKQKGSPNIFMNILTSSGLAARYISDWAGPNAVFKNLKLRLGVPNYPDDCMVMSAVVDEISGSNIKVSFQGINSAGPHMTGSAELEIL